MALDRDDIINNTCVWFEGDGVWVVYITREEVVVGGHDVLRIIVQKCVRECVCVKEEPRAKAAAGE
jgi:hypothetical protein